MAYVLIQHRVKRFSDFQAILVGGSERRKRMGSKGGQVFRDASDADSILILLEWESADKAREWLGSFESREALEWAAFGASPSAVIMERAFDVET